MDEEVPKIATSANAAGRSEYPVHIQSARVSWNQFEGGFIKALALTEADGQPTPLFLVSGNHDVSNAIGSPNRMVPETDATSMAEIYNRMMGPAVPRTKDTYSYAMDKVYFARDLGGAHCVFLPMAMGPSSSAEASSRVTRPASR